MTRNSWHTFAEEDVSVHDDEWKHGKQTMRKRSSVLGKSTSRALVYLKDKSSNSYNLEGSNLEGSNTADLHGALDDCL